MGVLKAQYKQVLSFTSSKSLLLLEVEIFIVTEQASIR